MSKNTNRIIDVISGIDEALIDKATNERIKFFKVANRKKRKLVSVIALAAAFAILSSLLLFILVPMLTQDPVQGQVPIYTGMSASGEGQSTAYGNGLVPLSALIPLDNQNFEGNNGNHGTNNPNKKPINDIIEEPTTEAPETTVLPDGTIEVIPTEELYYAKPDEDIFITIHFDNPDDYKIMSFKLNGVPYADYMFEYGSDYENIIIKVNVGETEGLVDYTIDAIQYADREILKYVEMQGDPTLTIGVATEKQPKAEITNEIIGINDFSAKVEISDEISLLEKTNGTVSALISDGEKIISFKPLTVGEINEIKFEDLKTSTYYQYAIVAVYDALDGQGFTNHILYQKEFTTREVLAFSGVSSDKTSISFTTLFNENAETKEITAITLYLDGEKVRDMETDATHIDGLLSDSEYTVVITYINKGQPETISRSIKTLAKIKPEVILSQKGESTQTSFEFDLVYSDPDAVGQITMVELLHGEDETVLAGNLDVREFEDLLSNNEYTVKVTFSFDLNDGVGETIATETLTVKTKAKTIPTYGLADYVSECESVAFDIEEKFDPDGIGEIVKAELYNPDGSFNRVLDMSSKITLDDLVPMDIYVVLIVFECDLNDGKGTLTKTIEASVSTATSKGLTKRGGKITGIGSCEDNVLYINSPIDANAFKDNTDIVGIILGDGVTEIGEYAFSGCKYLSGTLDLSGVRNIGSYAFSGCPEVDELILVGANKKIGMCAFNYLNVSGILDLSSVEVIGSSAFARCPNLTGIVLGKQLERIGSGAFLECINISGTVDLSGVTEIGSDAFYDCQKIESFIFGKEPTKIGEKAFFNCDSFVGSVDLSSVINIGVSAFENCDISGTVDLSNAEVIGNSAFSGCKNIEKILFGSGSKVITVGEYAFNDCKKLSGSLDLSGVAEIGAYAFNGCENIDSIVFWKSLRSIGGFAFNGCTNLSGTLDLSGVSIIGESAFYNCVKIEAITFGSKLQRIEANAFCGCANISGTIDLSSAESIGSGAFNGCAEIDEFIFGSKLRIIDSAAFAYCGASGILDLSSVRFISGYAFEGCTNISGIILGKPLESIYHFAFYGCSAFRDIYYKGSEEEWNSVEKELCWDDDIGGKYTMHYNYDPALAENQ